MEIKGISISAGIAIGKAYVYSREGIAGERRSIEPSEIETEQQRWLAAKATAAKEIAAFVHDDSALPEETAILAAHAEILDDEEIDCMVRDGIEELKSAGWAIKFAFDKFSNILAKSDNELIAERAVDMRDVCSRVLAALNGKEAHGIHSINEPSIVVAADLLPSEAAMMDKSSVLGLVLEAGGSTSHSAIIARSCGIPAVFGAKELLKSVKDNDMLIADGDTGTIITSPDEGTLVKYREMKKSREAEKIIRAGYLHKAARLKSGEAVSVGINIGGTGIDDVKCCDFVGLYRSEFLYMDSDHLPTEDEQFQAYKAVLVRMEGKPVTLRTLDIGGDKTLSYMSLPRENNPFLGKRAIRLCFEEEGVFRTQLRAAYRASVYGKLKLMFPMIGSLDDWRRAKAIALSVRDELRAEKVDVARDIELGIMIEIPSIALLAEAAAQEVDFASIGTNDLCQYTCAADRMEPGLNAYYQPYSPAMILLLNKIIQAFTRAGKEISMCGELAGDPKAAALLAGMGLRKFSVSPSSVSDVKMALSSVEISRAEELARAAAKCATEGDVLGLVNMFNET